MLYSKPDNLKYTDLCIFFDENFYSDNRDDDTCYKYMYLIYYMLACKKKYFHKFQDYENYAIFAASTIYMRFIKKQQNGERIKSLLNYAKATCYPLKVMFQRNEFRESFDEEHSNIEPSMIQESLKASIQSQYNYGLEDAIVEVFNNIPHFIREEISRTPYKTDVIMSKRIYISCLITLLKSFTLSNNNQSKLNKRIESGTANQELLVKLFNREREYSTTVWRLDESMGDYIQLLANKIRIRIQKELKEARNSFALDDTTLEAILMTAWEGTNHSSGNDFEED